MLRVGMALAVLLVAPSGAAAATLRVVEEDFQTTVVYAAAPGEANAPELSVTPDGDGSTVEVTDAGATVTARAPCEATATGARCAVARPTAYLRILLGDGDDVLSLDLEPGSPGFARLVSGGPGDDVIDARTTLLLGGDGADALTNRSQTSRTIGGPGEDGLTAGDHYQVLGGGAGSDTIDGGEHVGITVSFAEATSPVTADLRAQGSMGPEGEPDAVTGADGVVGGRAADDLTGSQERDRISGGPGDDAIAGLGGPDHLEGGEGTDRIAGAGGADDLRDRDAAPTPDGLLDGGAGGDDIRATGGGAAIAGGEGNDRLRFDGAAGAVDAGAGADVLFVPEGDLADAADVVCGGGRDMAERFERALVPADCERIGFVHPKVTVQVANGATLVAGALRVPVPNLCFGDCRVRTTLAADGRRIGRLVVRLEGNGNGRASFALTGEHRRLVVRAGQVTLRYVPVRGTLIDPAFSTVRLREVGD
jgi:Ca2+-binding RTX toxin-like protein